MLPWTEKVPMLSIHPDAASRDDIAKLATELMEANKQIASARDYLWGRKAGYVKGLEDENRQLKKQIGDLRATAVRKGLMKGGSFTGKT